MQFKNRIKPLKKSILVLGNKQRGLYLAFLIINILLTLGCIKYLATWQNEQNFLAFTENYAQNASEQLSSKLDNVKFKQEKLEQQFLIDYLATVELESLVLVAVFGRDGRIVASNFKRNSEIKTSFNQGAILNYLEQNFTNLYQSRRLSFLIDSQPMIAVATPWEDRELGIYWLAVSIVPSSELAIDNIEHNRNWLERYSAYLLPVILWETLTYLRTALFRTQLARPRRDSLTRNEIVPPEEQSSFLGKQPDLAIENLDQIDDRYGYLLLAEMSHELRSPLNAILGFTQIMEQELPTKSSSQENIAIINRNGDRLLSIINDVVDLAKMETNRLTLERNHVDFYSWLDHLEHSFQFYPQEVDCQFALTREEDLPPYICIDERRLRQIIGNLIDYCFQSSSSGEIDLRVTADCSEDRHNCAASNLICFEIKNNNFVRDSRELATLFESMARVKQELKATKGSSLNLPLSRKLARLMEGDIVVVDNTRTTASITFKLSIRAENILPQQLSIQSTVKRIIGLESDQIKYRILVVDDSKTNRKIMSQLLESVGFQVQEAVNGKEAIAVWLRWQPHMIWMDLKMPVMNGCEATERIKFYAHDTHVPIVALSASSLEEEKSLLQAAGCDDFVAKPYSEKIIFDKIAQHLGIRYIYESNTPSSSHNFKLTADSLKVMPNPWLEQVAEAAFNLDRDSLMQLLQSIPTEHTDLKNALQRQIKDFNFDRILNLARNSQKD